MPTAGDRAERGPSIREVTAEDQRNNRRQCLTPQCGKVPTWKGLCTKCYGSAKKLVEKGATTWEQLAALGLAEGVADDRFTAAFKELKSKRMAELDNDGEVK